MKTWGELVRDLRDGDLVGSVKYTFAAGLLAHGVALFNKLSWRGDLNHGFILELEKSITLGRWLKAFLCYIVSKVFGGKNLSLPLFFGVVSMLLIALSAHIITRLFDIRRKPLRMALCAMLVVFPVVASTFAYMFDAPYYYLAMLLAVAGVYIAAGRPRWDGFAVAALCVCGCLAIYQAYFPVAVSLFVILLILEIARGRYASLSKAILRGVYYLGVCLAALVLFFAVWKLVMAAMGLSASDYQGASSIGQSGIRAYIGAAVTTYKRFLLHFAKRSENLYPMKLAWVQWLIIAASGFSGLYILLRHFRRDKWQAALMALLMAAMPLCFNLVYLLAASSPSEQVYVYSLMLYGQCMLYVFLICALDFIWDEGRKPVAACCRAAVAVLALMVCMDVYYDNSCYLKAEMLQQQAISDMTVLVSRIKSTEGYNDKMPVCFVMEGKKDATLASNEAFEDITIVPFDRIYPYHTMREVADFLEKWCGFAPKMVSSGKFKKMDEVRQMPDYPDEGSVRIIDGTVVVKR